MFILLYQNSTLLFFICLFRIPGSNTSCVTGEKSEYMRGNDKRLCLSHQIKQKFLSQSKEEKGFLYVTIYSYVKVTAFQRTVLNSVLIVKGTIYFPKLSDISAMCIYDPTSKTMNKSFQDLRVLFDVKVVHNI